MVSAGTLPRRIVPAPVIRSVPSLMVPPAASTLPAAESVFPLRSSEAVPPLSRRCVMVTLDDSAGWLAGSDVIATVPDAAGTEPPVQLPELLQSVLVVPL